MAGTVLAPAALDRPRPAAHPRVARISGFQIRVSQRLQLGDADNTALVSDTEPRQQVFQRDALRLHAVAAGPRRQPGLGELAEAARDIRIRRRGVERLER